MSKKRRVVITGIGLLCAAGTAIDLWNKSVRGISCIQTLVRPLSDNASHIGGVIPLDIDQYLPKRINTYMPKSGKIAAGALSMCIKDSGLDDLKKTGLIYGTASLGADNIKKICDSIIDKRSYDHRYFLTIIPNGIIQYLANYYKITGKVLGINKASSAGLATLVEGYNSILGGSVEKVFCGAADHNLNDEIVLFYKNVLGIQRNFFGSDNRKPEKAVIPFCNREVSTAGVLGDAGCFFLLENYDSAKKRKAKIHAEITGIGDFFYSDGLSGEDREKVGMKEAISQAIAHTKIGYSVQSAAGFWLVDKSNYKVLHDVCGPIDTTSIEPIIAHTGAPSGMLNAFIAIKAIQEKTIVPTINVKHALIDPEFKLNYFSQAHKKTIDNALVISSGFGGFNTALVFAKVKS